MTEASHRLFIGLMAHMGWGNKVHTSIRQIGRKCGLAPASVPRALHALERACLIHVDRAIKNRPTVTISPFIVWQGRPHHVYYARRVFEERCRLSARDRHAGQQHEEDNAALAAVAALP